MDDEVVADVMDDLTVLFEQLRVRSATDRASDMRSFALSLLQEGSSVRAPDREAGFESVWAQNVEALERNVDVLLEGLREAESRHDHVFEILLLMQLRMCQYGLMAMGVPFDLLPRNLKDFVLQSGEWCVGLEARLSARRRRSVVPSELPNSGDVLSLVMSVCSTLQSLRSSHAEREGRDGGAHDDTERAEAVGQELQEVQEMLSDVVTTMDAGSRNDLVREICQLWRPALGRSSWLHELYNALVVDAAVLCAVMSQDRAYALRAAREVALLRHRVGRPGSGAGAGSGASAGAGAPVAGGVRMRHLGMRRIRPRAFRF